ncbi:TonB-dependent receptor plug domain-containing protein [Sphingobacterium phlebotomi]|uniref:TonB-dependent receptor plug domain-containing protein n=1 Tax=Sphingobacterium phlebotomi TaxID=2605433 RepID=A0A5D4HEX5_9SPHI|nr:TonB-dependent receptor plug domain-containing protein [Sphingobacterium phlebotomi]TYR37390.1 TonB-dependent receptor plug domain-containing protein [Sphingobacterium phlebotomi]
MNMKRLLLLCFFTLATVGIKAQDLQGLLAKINAYHDSRPIEKLYLHIDKYTYTAGETIWFKAYTTVGIDNLLSNISNIAYVELISPKEEVVSSIRIPILTGLGMGDITLTDTLVEGTYRIRAYTNWMRNDSTIYFFNENIQVSNGRLDNVLSRSYLDKDNYTVQLQDVQGDPLAEETIRYEIISKSGKNLKRGRVKTNDQGQLEIPFKDDYAEAKLSISFANKAKAQVEKIFKLPKATILENSIQFFPEGGNLLANSINKIAVKTLKPDGLGIESRTTILTTAGDTTAIIETNILGMGSVPLFIQNTQPLVAFTTFEDGTTIKSELPTPVSSGYNIQMNNGNGDKLFAQVGVSADKQDGNEIYFLAQYMGNVYYASKQPASKSELIFSVPKTDLPNGILTISILNNKLEPLIERPVFVYNEKKTLPLITNTDTPTSTKRKKITVSLETGDSSDSIRTAVLSASVVNASKLKNNPKIAPNILSSLLLSADIMGYIENPGYYFDGEIKTSDIDHLLLTQGWRKIDITAPLDVSEPTFSPEKSISIKGQARKLGRKAPASKANMVLVPTHNFMEFIDTVANEEGYFEFSNLFFPDSIKFLITAKDEKGKNNIDIIVPEETSPTIGPNKNAPGEQNNVNSIFVDELIHSKKYFSGLEAQGLMEKSIAIQEVIVTAQRPRHKASERSANLNGPGNADQVISAEDLETCTTLEMCLNGRLMGVMFRNGIPYTTRGGGEMQVILDGMYVENDMLSMINPMDVQSVEVLRNVNYTAIYGSYGGNGLIIITSKSGADAMRSNYTPKGIATVQPKGFHIHKTFYKPAYEPDSKTILNQDLRTTIHWEPNIITDENGKAAFDFYTSDEAGEYLIIIEGLDFNGRLGRKTLTVNVK